MGAMSKRTDTIKSLFATPQASPLSADNNAPPPLVRVSAGAVRSVRETFTEVERENQELRDKMAAGAVVVDIDAALVDPSPVSDRFRDDDATSYEILKQSIAQNGQEVPILVRHHPTVPGRYQSAYGHRRVRAARELGISVKAILKSLSDEALVVAQGLENAPREDLSFIERAVFALRIEEAGHKRSVVQDALAIDRAEASKLIAVAKAIPPQVVEAIGKAAKIGRGRWQAFAELADDTSAIERIEAAISSPTFAVRDSEGRFFVAFAAAEQPAVKHHRSTSRRPSTSLATNGRRIAQIHHADRELKLIIDKKVPASFADFLISQLPRLFETFSNSDEGGDVGRA
jgi:ParB family transcriptional regulator, chromosome partitioning protein